MYFIIIVSSLQMEFSSLNIVCRLVSAVSQILFSWFWLPLYPGCSKIPFMKLLTCNSVYSLVTLSSSSLILIYSYLLLSLYTYQTLVYTDILHSRRKDNFYSLMFVSCIIRHSRNDQHYALVVPLLYSIYWLLYISVVACHHQGAS
jgi:hypothetical protein